MKKSMSGILAAMAGLACCGAAQAQVVISAIYTGGGSSSTMFLSAFEQDFVILKNNGTSPASINGWSLQYAAATGVNWNKLNLPNATIAPGGFYLVRVNDNTPNCGVGAPCLPVPFDFQGSSASGELFLAGTAGKVALVSNQVTITAGTGCPTGATILDFVGYGNGSTQGQPTTDCAETAPTNNTGNEFVLVRQGNGCQDTNNNFADFSVVNGAVNFNPPLNSTSAPAPCTGDCPADCDNNAICDRDEINANGGTGGIGGTLDCNGNGQLDSCELITNPQIDCDGNGVIDSCQIDADPTLDCDSNGAVDTCQIFANAALDCNLNFQLDSCEINAAGGTGGIGGTLDCDATGRLDTCERIENAAFFDANNNGINDGCETPGPGQDCNANNRLDSWDLRTYVLTDVDGNNVPDTCEGAVYVEATVNATVQPTGVRSGVNNERFVNVEGVTFGDFASYAGIRWENSAVMSGLPATATVDRVYLRLVQSNAGFTNSGAAPGNDVEVFYTNNDTQSFANGSALTTFPNFASNYADRQDVTAYDFVRGTNVAVFGTATGSGTIESYKLFDVAGPNNPGGVSIKDELESRTGTLTVLLNPIAGAGDGTAATYAGWDNLTTSIFNRNGPSLVVFPSAGLVCNDIDFNNDGGFFDPTDVDAFLSVFGEGPCIPETATCDSIDFNNDGGFFDPCDIDSFLLQFAEGPCTPCGL